MIFVTGGTGLVGTHLIYELTKEKKSIRVLIRNEKGIDRIRQTLGYYSDQLDEQLSLIEWVHGDISDYSLLLESTRNVEEVYHCAAVVSYIPSARQRIIRENTQMAANIVDACLVNKVPVLCHLSSIATLGEKDNPITEETSFEFTGNNSAYSKGKLNAEMEVWRGVAEGLNAVVVNPSVVIGPGNWSRSSSAIFETVARGLKFYTEGTTGFIDVRDVAKLCILLTKEKMYNERFLLSAENMGYRELFNHMSKHLNVKPPHIKVNPFIAALAYNFENLKYRLTGKEPLITKETARISQKTLNYSAKKVVDKTGYSFTPITKSIEDTAKIYVNEKAVRS